MIKISSFLILFFSSMVLSAQTVRTDVTIIGGSPAGISAAIQAARSGVKSLILEDGPLLKPQFSLNDLMYLERIRDYYGFKNQPDSLKKVNFKPAIRLEESSQVVKSITDTVKNLKVMLNSSIRKIEKDGKGWEIKLNNGRSIKTDVVIDASKAHIVAAMLKIEPQKTIIQINNWIANANSTPRLFRTSVGPGFIKTKDQVISYLIPAASLMPAGIENLFLVPVSTSSINPEAMLAGQATGASAAYCAYFKTTSKNLNVRVTQGELLAYGSRLIPFKDIAFNDRHAVALQHISLTGILKAKPSRMIAREELIFDTLGTVSSEELRLPMREFYSRSQIWFPNHKKDSMTIEDTINLLQFTATRGEELRREIETGWKSSFQFSSVYSPKRAINRREFAVLIDTYLQPFNVRIDLNGNLLN